MTSDSDGLLLDQYVRTQDPVAFDQIARRYRPMVFATARRVTRSHHDAEDVAQNCFLELAKKAASIHISVAAFLHSTATRRSIDLMRDQSRRRKYEQQAATDRLGPSAELAAPQRDWEEISPEVDEAIDRLPEDQKTVIIFYFLRGLSIPDIVVETGLNKGIIERRLQVGVRRLRADLAKGDRVVSAGVLTVGLKASASTVVPASLTAATGRMAFAAGSQRQLVGQSQGLRHWYLRWPTWLAPTCSAVLILSLLTVVWTHRTPLPAKASSITPYDEINRMYASYLPVGVTSQFSLHTTQIKSDGYSFWRGSQTLFYQWCKSNCKDWLADSGAYVLCDGSPDLEDSWRSAQFSNTDNSTRIPMQIELLQGMITARIATDQSPENASIDSAQLADAVCQTYQASLAEDQPAVQPSLPGIEFLGTDRYTDALGNLKPLILNSQGKLVAFLRPASLDTAKVERLLADALSRNPRLQNICGSGQPEIREVRSCVRHDGMITDAELILIVQLQGSGILLEMKQQTPAPAELADVIPRDQRSPAQRAAEDAAVLSSSGVAPVGWSNLDNESFTVAPLALYPQVCELSHDRWPDPIQAGRAWATATAVKHRNDPHRAILTARITPELQAELAARCDAYLQVMHADLHQFNTDWRVARDRAEVNELSAAWSEQVRLGNK